MDEDSSDNEERPSFKELLKQLRKMNYAHFNEMQEMTNRHYREKKEIIDMIKNSYHETDDTPVYDRSGETELTVGSNVRLVTATNLAGRKETGIVSKLGPMITVVMHETGISVQRKPENLESIDVITTLSD